MIKLEKIISISGKPGLYKLLKQNQGGFIVEDLAKGRKTAIGGNYNVSLLDNIAIFGETEEYPLGDVLQKIYDKEKGGPTISHKVTKEELIAFMLEILPDYDQDRVYDSHIKKLVQWYNILQACDLLEVITEEENKAEKEAASDE